MNIKTTKNATTLRKIANDLIDSKIFISKKIWIYDQGLSPGRRFKSFW